MRTNADRRAWAERMRCRLERAADILGVNVNRVPSLTAWIFGHRSYEEDLEAVVEFLSEGTFQKAESEWQERDDVESDKLNFSKDGAEALRKALKGNSAQLRRVIRKLLADDVRTREDRGDDGAK